MSTSRPASPGPRYPQHAGLPRRTDDLADRRFVFGVVEISGGEEIDLGRFLQDAFHVAAKNPRLRESEGTLVIVLLVATGFEMGSEDAQAIFWRDFHRDIENAPVHAVPHTVEGEIKGVL